VEVDRLRLIARLPDRRQVGFLVDSLRKAGFDRKDMVITDFAEELWDSPEQVLEDVLLVQTERESIRWGETGAFAQGVKGLKGKEGIIVAVETPKHSGDRVRSIMEQSGAVEVVEQ
jgi:hypothetical protein